MLKGVRLLDALVAFISVYGYLIISLLRLCWQKWRRIALLLAVTVFLFYVMKPEVREAVLRAFLFAIQLAVYIAMAIIQFVAIFWFVARTPTVKILPGDPKEVTLDDYWGQPELVKLGRSIIYTLENRHEIWEMGGEPLKGILLKGPPGTGKTYFARCLAGSLNGAFWAIEGSGFRAMFWGVDVMKIISFCRTAKKLAKEYGVCIAFIDEIDAIGMTRGAVQGGQEGMRFPFYGGLGGALSQLLTQLDGIDKLSRMERLECAINDLANHIRRFLGMPERQWRREWAVLFMGATNRPDVLDPALTRPGRLDKQITVDKPDKEGRIAIIRGYLDKVASDPGISVPDIAELAGWATPAKLKMAITKDAVRIACSRGRSVVTQRDIEDALQEQAVGIAQPIADMSPVQRWQVAVHEAGHAVATWRLMPDRRIVRVSIVRRSEALGYVLPVDVVDQWTMPIRRLVSDIMVSLAGYAATEVVLGEPWTGARGDLNSVYQKFWILVGNVPRLGFLVAPGISDLYRPRGDEMQMVRDFMEGIIESCYDLCRENRDVILALAAELYRRGDLTGDEAVGIMEKASAGEYPLDLESIWKEVGGGR